MLSKASPEHPPSCRGLRVPPPVPSGQGPAFIPGQLNPTPAKVFFP